MKHWCLLAALLTALPAVACSDDDDSADGGSDGGAGGAGNVEGYVVLQGQTDHSGADVTLDGTDRDVVSIETGLYAFHAVPAGTYTVTASLAGYVEITSAPFEVLGGQAAAVPPLTLEAATGGLDGFVLLDGEEDHSGTAVEVSETSHTTVTAADGSWSIAEVEAGQYTISATHDGFLPNEATDISVLAGQVTSVPPIELATAVWMGNYEINNQTELDALIGYVEVTGNLQIAYSSDLTDLAGLEQLSAIGQVLTVMENTALQSLDGLDNLESVDTLYIADNDSLTSLSALGNLTTLDEQIWISQNGALTSLVGLAGITSAMGIVIGQNAVLASLDGLENLASLNNTFEIWENPLLTNLDPLFGITDCGGSGMIMQIYGNTALPFCEICDLFASSACEFDTITGTIENNLADTCWSGTDLVCP